MGKIEAIIDQALVGESQAIHEVRCFLKFAAATNVSVLVTGPSGCGKEVIANTLHKVSQRADQPFVAVNSGAVPKDLMEAEFFGHEKGSFTGASARRMGHFERADKGTLFLDEIGEMTPEMQVRLLRVLEDGKVRRVGGAAHVPVDVRIVTATHQSLESRIATGDFREDLFYRLCVLPLCVPALKERQEDIDLLVQHFLRNQDGSSANAFFAKDAMQLLMDHDWPGNVRELRNVVERAKIIHPEGCIGREQVEKLMYRVRQPEPETFRKEAGNPVHQMIGALHDALISEEGSAAMQKPVAASFASGAMLQEAGAILDAGTLDEIPEGFSLKDHLKQEECRLMKAALDQSGGIVAAAARLVNLERTTFVEKMKRYNLARPQYLAA